ncbi:hypothetical protein MKO06_02860 [Gramella sp. GC03-9]|uniref:Uncharacterized protein n=1 Tax=Christiangramia oceanisediminis TaxID=2920386 RepID=A0A9X2I1B5_9FLAO|nr:hypothetical protein [Gramella oceanisediminis]MCP9198830.1 hypothetical protein [Gramella oceanisediminis]
MTENQSQVSEQRSAQENLPRLYSKRVIYIFSVMFSTIFGTVILMSNLKQLGEKKARIEVLVFGIIFTIGTAITLNTVELQTNLGIPLNILGGVILNEFFWNRYIGRETEFEKKSWHKPALISALITLPFAAAMIYSL